MQTNLDEIQKCSLTRPVRFQVTIDPPSCFDYKKPEQSSLNRRVDPGLDVNCFVGWESPARLSVLRLTKAVISIHATNYDENAPYGGTASVHVSSSPTRLFSTTATMVFKWPTDAASSEVPRLRPIGATRHSLCQNPFRYGTPSQDPCSRRHYTPTSPSRPTRVAYT
jgi:hypothetical protein